MELLACLYHRGKKFLEDYESPGISCKAQFRPKPWTLLPLHKHQLTRFPAVKSCLAFLSFMRYTSHPPLGSGSN